MLQVEGATPTKPYDVCDTLARHNISLAALSEVRWKGSGSIQLGDYLCHFSGLPEAAPVAQQGVGIMLNPAMTSAWKAAGSRLLYAGARLMKIVLKLQKRLFHVVAVYAPAFRASDQEEESFYTDSRIQQIILERTAAFASCKKLSCCTLVSIFNNPSRCVVKIACKAARPLQHLALRRRWKPLCIKAYTLPAQAISVMPMVLTWAHWLWHFLLMLCVHFLTCVTFIFPPGSLLSPFSSPRRAKWIIGDSSLCAVNPEAYLAYARTCACCACCVLNWTERTGPRFIRGALERAAGKADSPCVG